MSGFLPLDELEPTLSDVLAFIDTFDSSASSPSTSSPCSTSSEDGGSSPQPEPHHSSPEDKRKTRKAAASRRCQQKKRAELLALRAQAAALESRLQELQSPRRAVLDVRRLDKKQRQSLTRLWMDKARYEKQLRQDSENRNRQLKTVLARQSKVAQAVQGVLSNVAAAVHIEEALRTPPPTNFGSGLEGFVPNLHDAVYGELSARLGRLYLNVSSQLKSLDTVLVKDASTGVQVRRDVVTGVPYVELKLAMATGLTLHQTEKAVMSMKACHYTKIRHYLTEMGTKKESEVELRDQENAVALSTLSLSRPYEDENRVTFMFSSLVCGHPTDVGMRFREEGFILMTQSPSNPHGGTTIQSCYRLTPDVSSEPFSPTSSPAMPTDATKEFVLQNLGARMWKNFQSVQAQCVEAELNPAAIPATC